MLLKIGTERDVDVKLAESAPACGFRAWGWMPPCVLPKGHSGDHSDGFGGHYTDNMCGCGAVLSAHEKTTEPGDCFGCRADRRKAKAVQS